MAFDYAQVDQATTVASAQRSGVIFASLPAIATTMTRIPSMVAIALSIAVIGVGVGNGNAQSPDFDADLALFNRYVDALARFEREPRALAALNHPNTKGERAAVPAEASATECHGEGQTRMPVRHA